MGACSHLATTDCCTLERGTGDRVATPKIERKIERNCWENFFESMSMGLRLTASLRTILLWDSKANRKYLRLGFVIRGVFHLTARPENCGPGMSDSTYGKKSM